MARQTNKSYAVLSMYKEVISGQPLNIMRCCNEYGISVPTFRRYVALLREFLWEKHCKELFYDGENQWYLIK